MCLNAAFRRALGGDGDAIHQRAAVAQVVLEGIPLPATKKELLDYARRQDPPEDVAAVLSTIPDREYERLVREPAPVGEGSPKAGERGEKPR